MSNQAAGPGLTEGMMNQATNGEGTKSLLGRSELLRPIGTFLRDAASSYMKGALAVLTVPKGTEPRSTALDKRVSDTTAHSTQAPTKYVATPSSYTEREIKRLWADLGVLMKTNVEMIVKAHLTKWKSTL